MNIKNAYGKINLVSSIFRFIFFLLVGIILLGFGILTLSGQSGDFEKTDAVIEEINPLGDGEYQVVVSYTVNGVKYRSALGYYSSDMMKGNSITIKYAPDDPTNIRSSSVDIIGYVLVAGGVIMLFVGIKLFSKGLKVSREIKEQSESFTTTNGTDTISGRAFPTEGEGTLYYFHYDKSFFKQGHVMEDSNRQVIYEGAIKAFKVIGDFEMDFINHISGRTETHFIGHTITTETSDIITSSGFNYDGKNIWEYLKERGVNIDFNIDRLMTGMTYDITLNGIPFAKFVSSGANLYGEEKQGLAKVANLSAPGLFRIYSYTDDLDLLFLIGVAFTRSKP